MCPNSEVHTVGFNYRLVSGCDGMTGIAKKKKKKKDHGVTVLNQFKNTQSKRKQEYKPLCDLSFQRYTGAS